MNNFKFKTSFLKMSSFTRKSNEIALVKVKLLFILNCLQTFYGMVFSSQFFPDPNKNFKKFPLKIVAF